ncbi:MAG TPA: SDR family NAD(P)-dependent oxidoreductase [Balneolaceae bacterium]|nr:SDR family NAD(P)-dependent oxidoreductase [Balneolaceae bacterium]
MNISGNTILITGGTSGIGLGFAEAFLNQGNDVIICGRREQRLKQIKKKHPEIIIRISDISKDEQRQSLFEWVAKHHPKTNMLINNAGVQLKTDLTQPVDMQRVRTETDVNFYGPIHLSSLFARHLADKKDGAIINISSGLAFTPIAWMPIYCATKAALHSLTLSLRHQLKDTPVKVFEIIPPSVDTELGHDYRSDPNKSHGGMPISDFVDEALDALKKDKLEYAVGRSKNLHEKREKLFDMLNS